MRKLYSGNNVLINDVNFILKCLISKDFLKETIKKVGLVPRDQIIPHPVEKPEFSINFLKICGVHKNHDKDNFDKEG